LEYISSQHRYNHNYFFENSGHLPTKEIYTHYLTLTTQSRYWTISSSTCELS